MTPRSGRTTVAGRQKDRKHQLDDNSTNNRLFATLPILPNRLLNV